MFVNNDLFKALRKYKGMTLNSASSDICSASALSQFETNKINLSEANKFKLLKKYGVKFVPQDADMKYMSEKNENLNTFLRNFYIPSCQKTYEVITRREGYLYYDSVLLIDSFNTLVTYEILHMPSNKLAMEKIELLNNLEHLMTTPQRKNYYFNLALIQMFEKQDLEEVEEYFRLSMDCMTNGVDEFIMFWYSYAMKYFGKKMLSIKHYQEVERHFMVNNNFLGIQNVLLELSELFLIVEEYDIASRYIEKYSEKRKLQKTTFTINDGLYYLISGQLEFINKRYKRALTQYHNAARTSKDYYIHDDLEDYLTVAMLKAYKIVDTASYIEETNRLKKNIDFNIPRYSTTYLLKHEYDEVMYEEYINKTIIPNQYLLSNRNYSAILQTYRYFLTTKKKYSALSKIILK